MGKCKIGLALGSGGARGWCHIGVLRELDRQGFAPDVVAGCSMGALVGAAWAAGRLDALEDWARSLTRMQFLRYVDPRLDRGGLVQGGALARIFEALDLPETIEDLDKPFLVVATDMVTGREIWLTEGPLLPAVRASISIPGVFSPVQVDGRWLMDGGLVNPVPASACRALGAIGTIAVNPNAKHGHRLWTQDHRPDMFERLGAEAMRAHLPGFLADWIRTEPDATQPPNYFDVVSTALDILIEYVRKAREATDPPHVALDPNLMEIDVLELYTASPCIDEGVRVARAAAEDIAALRDL